MTRFEIISKAHEIRKSLVSRFPVLADVTIELSRSQRIAGQANTSEKRVFLSYPLFSKPENEEHFDNTVRHELAHIVSPAEIYMSRGKRRRRSHGPEWRKAAVALGAKPKRCHAMATPKRKRRASTKLVSCNCGAKLNVGAKVQRKIHMGVEYKHTQCGAIIRIP